MNNLRYDPRCMVADGLPHLGKDEQFYHASFEVEGVVAAPSGQVAAELLLSTEARHRFCFPSDLLAKARYPLSGRLTRVQALELAPKVAHRVSLWKQATPTEPGTQSEMALA